MASWRSASTGRRSSSPGSPLSPVPSQGIPAWLRPSRSSKAVVPPGRYKVLLAALTCIVLGWFMTAALGPVGETVPEDMLDMEMEMEMEMAGSHVLNDPAGYGQEWPTAAKAASPSLGVPAKYMPPVQRPPPSAQSPSIKGALGDLHKAIGGKLSGWKPYSASGSAKTTRPTNTTSELTVQKPQELNRTGEDVYHGMSEDQRLGARTRIGKCTILFNGNSYWERAIRTHEAHDRMHDYRLHVLRQHLLDDVWSKPAYILSLLLRELGKPEHERLEWLFWVDADTIILNPHVPIEVFLPPADFDHVHFLYSEDWNGLNNGVFPVRVNKWSVELFSAIVSYRYYRPEGSLVFRDQSAMNTLMREAKFVKNIVQLPQRWFNAYQGEHNETLAPYQTRRGDLLVHFAGVVDREPRMNFWLDRAEQHLDDWEVPLKSTSYPQEVKDFWNEQRVSKNNHVNALSEARLAASELLGKIDEQLGEFQDRLSAEQVDKIKQGQGKLRGILGDQDAAEDLDKLTETTAALEDVLTPLNAAKADNHRILVSSAHDAIFTAEKDLVEAGFYKGITSPDLNELDDATKKLKELVLLSEDKWTKENLNNAVDAVTIARGKVQERLIAVEAAAASASASAAAAAASAAQVAKAAQAENDANRAKEEQKMRLAQAAQANQAAEAKIVQAHQQEGGESS